MFGAGLLVGTALTVIIPEGIRALYSDVLSHSHTTNSKAAAAAAITGATIDVADLHDDNTAGEHSSTIGLSLVLGFVFMMLVDQISTRRTSDASTAPSSRNSTATIGLVVHAAADGIALGAAATTSHQDVEMIVFLAIMLHKAPAAFGLVSFLLHEGIDRQRIRKHLAIFSLSAPLLTLLTFFGIGQEQKETLNSLNATGIAMLFSAGTFLYVATVHVLPELTQQGGGGHSHGGGQSYALLDQSPAGSQQTIVQMQGGGVGPTPKGYSGLRNIELAILIAGALMPLLLTVGHHH